MFRFEFFAFWRRNLTDSSIILDFVSSRMVENADIVATDNVGSITLVADIKLRVAITARKDWRWVILVILLL